MVVAEFIAPRQFRLTDQPVPNPAPGEVQVRIGSVGICGSDLHAYREGGIGDMPCQFPMVLGHEPAGTVVKTGEGVTGWSPGDRAALEPAQYCYHCEACRTGRHNLCLNIRFLSNPGLPGFHREFINLPAVSLLPVPAHVSLDVATLAEPLAVALHSLRLASIQGGETVAVYGAGPIGLLTIASLKVAHAGRILAVEPLAHRRELARLMGADAVLEPDDEAAVRNVDCVFECAADVETTNQAIRAVRWGGRVVITGIHSDVRVPFEVSPMRRKELTIICVRRSNHDSHRAVEMLSEKPQWFAPLITHTRPITDITGAFSIAETYADGVGKMVIRP